MSQLYKANNMRSALLKCKQYEFINLSLRQGVPLCITSSQHHIKIFAENEGHQAKKTKDFEDVLK